MRGRLSAGVMVAVIVAIAVATAAQSQQAAGARAESPVHVTLALEPDGLALRVAHGAFVVTFEI